MYLRWAIAMLALGLMAEHFSPRPLVDLLTMKAINASLKEMSARRVGR